LHNTKYNKTEQKFSRDYLSQKQSLPLDAKITLSQTRIREWYDAFSGQVAVSFSGGLDSVVLLDVVREIYPGVVGVFYNTGMEYPDLVKTVRKYDNIVKVRPKKSFKQVVQDHGFPVVSKEQSERIARYRNNPTEDTWNRISHRWRYLVKAPFKISAHCCYVLKKSPSFTFERQNNVKMMIGSRAEESQLRRQSYLKYGCNLFEANHPRSTPLAVWTKQDILEYIRHKELEYPQIYGDIISDGDSKLKTTGVESTGCMFCMFGVHLEKEPNRFHILKDYYPKLYNYCINKLGCGEVLDYIGVRY